MANKSGKPRSPALTPEERNARIDRSIARHQAAIQKLEMRKGSIKEQAKLKAAKLLSAAGVGFIIDGLNTEASAAEAVDEAPTPTFGR